MNHHRIQRHQQQQRFITSMAILLVSTTILVVHVEPTFGWMPPRSSSSTIRHSTASTLLTAKRNRGRGSNSGGGGGDDMNSWYDSVDDDATPDKVFWQEMERQRLSNQLPQQGNSFLDGVVGGVVDPVASIGSMGSGGGGGGGGGGGDVSSFSGDMMGGGSTLGAGGPSSAAAAGAVNAGVPGPPGPGSANDFGPRKPPTAEEQKAAEATLVEYATFAVKDNWLNEVLIAQMDELKAESMKPPEKELSIDEETERLVKQLEALPDGYGTGTAQSVDIDDIDLELRGGEEEEEEEEVWDVWKRDQDSSEAVDPDRRGTLQVKAPEPDSEYYLDDAPPDPEEERQAEENFWKRMSRCQISSRRLQKLQKTTSPAAKEFYARQPNYFQGYDTMWVSAIENACFKSLKGTFRNYGIEFADNFGDWFDGRVDIDSLEFSIEDIAAYKARLVYEATGLPCIASRTSFEIEPVPPEPSPTSGGGGGGKAAAAKGVTNPRVMSGYKINDIAAHADYLSDALRPMSELTRVTRFTSCLCYYDGAIEMFEHGVLDCDIHFANGMRTFIPMAAAINNMIETCQYTFGLEFQSFAKKRYDEASSAGGRIADGSGITKASEKLRDRVLKDGKILPNDIIDVSNFMDSQVDVNLMDECAKELANRFMDTRPTKIMTVATTGLVVALPMAKYLQVPVVYARKERTVVMADTYQAGFSSKTVGKNRELLVSKSHLDANDRVLVVDDFLSGGSSQEALLRIVNEAEATAVGVGVLLEKVYDSGRQSLSGFNIPIESLCRVASVRNGMIQLLEEDGFDIQS